MTMSRFWFHIQPNMPTFEEDEGAVNIDRCAVALLTEKQVQSADGQLRDDLKAEDPIAKQFAETMSHHFTNLTKVATYWRIWRISSAYAL